MSTAAWQSCALCHRSTLVCKQSPCIGSLMQGKGDKEELKEADKDFDKKVDEDVDKEADRDSDKDESDVVLPADDEDEVGADQLIINESTGESQEELIGQLRRSGVLFKQHWATVVGVDKRGVQVEMVVAPDRARMRFVLHDLHVAWEDFPVEIRAMPRELRIVQTLRSLPPGTQFRVKALSCLGNGRLQLVPAKFANPVFNFTVPPPFTDLALLHIAHRSRYRYLVVIDFEATCDYSPTPVVDTASAEVIEFPFCVLDTYYNCVIDRRQLFVKPDKLEGITYYCTKLTGIAPEHVHDSPSLSDALLQFDAYLRSRSPALDDFCIVTDGVWDLQVQLRSECQRKGIPIAPYLRQYFDVQEEFRKLFPWFPEDFRPNLPTMLKAFRLQFEGRPHCGLDDALNITRIASCLLNLGHAFHTPRRIADDYDYTQDAAFNDFGSVTEHDSWFCDNAGCLVWNRPWMYRCRFCERHRALTKR